MNSYSKVVIQDRKKIYAYIIAITLLYVLVFWKIFPKILPYTEGGLYARVKFDAVRTLVGTIVIVFMARFSYQYEMNFRQHKKVSSIVVLTLYLFYFIPGQIMNIVYETDKLFFWLYILFWLFLELFLHISNKIRFVNKGDLKLINAQYSKRSAQIYEGFVILILLIVIVISLTNSNSSLSIMNMFDIKSINETRMESREANIHWILWYPILAVSILNPVWFQRAWKNKNIVLLVLILFSTVAMYSVGNNRAFLLNLFIGFAICLLRDKNNSTFKIVFCCLAICAIEFMLSETILTNTIYDNPFNNVMKRLFATPNAIARHYVEFFSENQPDWLMQNWSRYFSFFGLSSSYPEPIPTVIGHTYYFKGMNSNNGLIGTAVANYGMLGVFISPLLYVFSFRLLDFCSEKIKATEELIVLGVIIATTIPNSFGFMELIVTPSYILMCYVLIFLMPHQTSKSFDCK